MKFNEVKEMFNGLYASVEVYRPANEEESNSFHTDKCISVEIEPSEETEVKKYELMDEEDYKNTILANSCIEADFEGWYGDGNAKVLCIMV